MLFRRDTKELELLRSDNEELRQRVFELESQLQSAESDLHGVRQAADKEQEGLSSKEQVNQLWLSSSDLLESIRGALAGASTELTQRRDQFEGSRELLGRITSMLAATAISTKKVSSDTREANQSVSDLKQEMDGINGFVENIRGISDQTNLLALNAAIEAARAGEQGRGFAVVADEVRTLAQRSAEATNEISNLIQKVNSQMEGVIQSIGEVGEIGSKITEDTQEIEGATEEIVDLSKSMLSVISNTTADAFIQTVKMDHVVWKLDVYKVMLGASNKTPGEFADHTMCRMGQWYYEGEGAQRYAKFGSFSKVETPHKDVHSYGFEAMAAQLNGDSVLAVRSLEKMEKASFDVIEQLSSLSEEIAGQD